MLDYVELAFEPYSIRPRRLGKPEIYKVIILQKFVAMNLPKKSVFMKFSPPSLSLCGGDSCPGHQCRRPLVVPVLQPQPVVLAPHLVHHHLALLVQQWHIIIFKEKDFF